MVTSVRRVHCTITRLSWARRWVQAREEARGYGIDPVAVAPGGTATRRFGLMKGLHSWRMLQKPRIRGREISTCAAAISEGRRFTA